MGLRKHAIEWREEPEAARGFQPAVAQGSPALDLQTLLQQHHRILTRPGIDRETLRRLAMMLVAGGCAVWATLLVSANAAVSLVV